MTEQISDWTCDIKVCTVEGVPGPPGAPGATPYNQTTTLYLASYGNDDADGHSPSTAFATLGKTVAVAKSLWGNVTVETLEDSGPILVPDEITWGRHDWLNAYLRIKLNGRTLRGSLDGSRTHDCLKPAYGALVGIENGIMHSFDTPVTAVYGAVASCTNINMYNVRKGMASSSFGFCSAVGGDWDGRDFGGVVIPDSIGFNAAICASGFLTQTAPFAGLKIHHFDRGATVHEASSLHMDDMWYDACRIGVEISRGAGSPNLIPLKVTNCTIGILNRGEIPLLISANLTGFVTTGTITPIVNTEAGVWQSTEDLNYDPRPLRQLRSTLSTSPFTGTTAEDDFWQIGRFVAAWGPARDRDTTELRLRGRCPDPGLVGTATLRLKIGGTTALTVVVPAGTALFGLDVFLSHINRTDIRGYARGEYTTDASGAVTANTKITEITTRVGILSTVDDKDFRITYQLSNSADQILITQGNIRSTIAGFLPALPS